MPLDFPNSPSNNQTFTSGGVTWRWDGSKWRLIGVPQSKFSDTPPAGASEGDVWVDTSTGTFYTFYDGYWFNPNLSAPKTNSIPASRNMLINGDFRVAQRGTTLTSTGGANNDDTYTLDRWVLLSDGNDIVDVTRSTDVPTGGLNSIGLDVETANKKFGILQIIEQANITGVQDQVVQLSFKARTTGSSISDVKAVVLAWTGTADSVTSDVVSAWNASGTVPTWATSWTAENTPTNLSVTNSWATYNVSATVDAPSTKNLAVFIWCDDATTTIGDFLYITDVQLEIGLDRTPFERRNINEEIRLCQRYYEKTYDLDTAPGTNTGLGSHWMSGTSDVSSNITVQLKFAVQKRITPNLLVWTIPGTSGSWLYQRSNVNDTASSLNWTTDWKGNSGGMVFFGVGAAYVAVTIRGHWVAEAEL